MGRILVTGAGGFVGRHLLPRLVRDGHALTLAYRSNARLPKLDCRITLVNVGEIGPLTDWRMALAKCDTVIHLAAQVPGRGIEAEAFKVVNDKGTASLVRQASEAGIRRFILLSSIFAVTGNSASECLDDQSVPRPTSHYGLSKLAAEKHIAEFTRSGGIGVSLRSPLIYGADAGGRWKQLQRLAASGVPLPFGAVNNRRSLIAVENLVDAIVTVAAARGLGNSGTFAVADDRPVSLSQILYWLREGMNRPARLFNVSPGALDWLFRQLKRHDVAHSLLGNLEINASRFKRAYSWAPALGPREAIICSGAGFMNREVKN